ncbi:MAG: pirin family protein, partial [Gammaproteobacteria bacterium]|nr:pirin family protein [Gammaproteobacteria bacterium]
MRRVLPAPECRAVGPFVFFDHMGPAGFPPGKGIQVRPHPHIGIATLTYLFEGAIMHRDSLGCEQLIEPGAVNLMTAGRGIVHSERAGDDLNRTSVLHGIQSWMALPDELEEMAPAFVHTPAAELPTIDVEGSRITIIAGSARGHTSPVTVYSPMLYLDCRLPAGAELDLAVDYDELGAYVVAGAVQVDDTGIEGGAMLVACPGKTVRLRAPVDSRAMVIGGTSVGTRHLHWNFVSSCPERIKQAGA